MQEHCDAANTTSGITRTWSLEEDSSNTSSHLTVRMPQCRTHGEADKAKDNSSVVLSNKEVGKS